MLKNIPRACFGFLPLGLGLPLIAASAGVPPTRLLDDFSTRSQWRAAASDGVSASGTAFEGGLRLDYDFTKGSGYAFLRRELPLDFPDNFELRFRLRGSGPANALELKLVDASGDNVWWHRKADYVAPGAWTTIKVKRRQIDFAWGPTQDRSLRRAMAIEFVVAAGSGGGKGWIAFDDLEIVPLPSPPAVPPPIVASAGAGAAVDRNVATAWSARPGATIDLDLGYRREFGGLALRWAAESHASDYSVHLSDDRRHWRAVRTVVGGDGATDWLKLEESEARYVRLRLARGPRPSFALAEIEVQPLAFGASDNAFIAAVAKAAPRGLYPRGFIDEQNYWTLIATPEGGESGLIDESGAIEVGRGGFSVEPFMIDGGKLIGWADVEARQTLRRGDLPIPSVEWSRRAWRLRVTGIAERERLLARYTVTNDGVETRELALVLAVRPFQVNPPQQFLNIRGGVSPIRSLAWSAGAMMVNGSTKIVPTVAPDDVKVSAFDAGPLPQSWETAKTGSVLDPTGLASGALVYRLRLAPGEEREFALALPFGMKAGPPRRSAGQAQVAEDTAVQTWRAQLDRVGLSGPPAARQVFGSIRSALAQMLMTREGPALRPGSRAYARSWIRDGAMMSTGLLRLGHPQAAIDFLQWYAPYQYPSGKVPCCVDARGADPVPEHDSDGQFIHLVAQLHRYAPDRARLEAMWPRVRAAADHIELLRQKTRVSANRAGPTRHYFGLLPPSISHEGYSAKPMHSYWDDFWALAGLKDATWLAGALGRPDEARLLAARSNEFRAEINASLAAAQAIHGIDFMPGAADLGDFDATSTTIALTPANEQHLLPPGPLKATFERYWNEFVARRDGGRPWDAYTPYEWRSVGAFVRLGWRERAAEAADFFMKDQRPRGWNQWAEVVGREPRAPRFVGDMPHGWVASDFVNAALDMLAYDRGADAALVLAAGVPPAWLEEAGIDIQRLRTPHGLLHYRLRRVGREALLDFRLEGRPPPGGLVFAWSGREHRLQGGEGRLRVPL